MRRLLVALLFAPLAAVAQPETRGPHPIAEVDVGRVNVAGVQIPVKVYAPMDMQTQEPVVLVVHGYFRNGSFMAEMARTLASRGMVAVVPDMPCGLAGCDHAANAVQIRALLDWAVADPIISARVDPTRRGVIGHSWGALATFLATTTPGEIDVAVLLDANDDRGLAAGMASQAQVPTAQVRAEELGSCNSAWTSAIFAAAPAPKLDVRVKGSAHCDAEEPSDGVCPVLCGRGDPAKSVIFRRYAVAFVSCVLKRDRTVAAWVEGAERAMDEAGGVIDQVGADGLMQLPCFNPVAADASVPVFADAATSSSADAAPIVFADAAPAAADDAAAVAPGDDAAMARPDPADAGVAASDAGLPAAADDGCQAIGGSTPAVLIGLLLLALGVRRKRA